ncbi:hypothetical protein E2C01_036133 [Portunus trituberculatus]|uniref:Uncharacterized protein n=1 Tax=Portunus trituberculatus TaxID=210409 RepID=A0A5B7F606_PORTR|nr:hypothetical protein [Portunus trituberculatus]
MEAMLRQRYAALNVILCITKLRRAEQAKKRAWMRSWFGVRSAGVRYDILGTFPFRHGGTLLHATAAIK